MKGPINLKVYIAGEADGILLALRQEGIPYLHNPRLGSTLLKDCAALFLTGEVLTDDIVLIKNYLIEGGTVLSDRINANLPLLIGGIQRNTNDLPARTDISIYQYKKGYLIHIDKELNRELTDTSSLVKEFVTPVGIVRERVARFSKSHARSKLSYGILLAYHLRGIPFIKSWYYPYPYTSAFNLRFDVDEDTADDLAAIQHASGNHKDCSSWFISCASFEKSMDKIKILIDDGFDVQSHGYYHHTYKDKRQNALSIDRSLEYLNSLHSKVEGFVAPKGIWNIGLQELLEERGLLYSSEFSLDYDNIPFYPLHRGHSSKVLQIPIHPICPGLYMDAGVRDEDRISGYFDKVILRAYQLNMPIFLYGHPNDRLGRRPKILENIYSKIDSLQGVWKVRLSEFARWWQRRQQLRFEELSFDAGRRTVKYKLKDGFDPADISLSIFRNNSESTLYRIGRGSGEFGVDSMRYLKDISQPQSLEGLYEETVYEPPLFKRIKSSLVDLLDWEKCTPLQELYRDSLLSRIKYLLRILRMI